MKIFKKFLVILFTIMIIFQISAFSAPIEIKIAHSHVETHPIGRGYIYFKDLVEDYTQGNVEVIIYPNSQLGEDLALVDLAKAGTIQISSTTCAQMAEGFPKFDIFGLPFLFRDYDHLWDVTRGPLRDILEESIDKENLKLLGITTSGARQLFSKKPINSVKDLENITIRAMSVPAIIKTWELLGARPVPVAWSEVYSALQTGVVDASESSIQGWFTLKHNEQAPYGAKINYSDSGRVYFVNKAFWNDLPEDLKPLIKIAWDKTEKFIQNEYKNQDDEIIEEIRRSGKGGFTFPNLEEFVNKIKPIYKEMEPTLGAKWIDIIQKLY